MTVVDTTRPVFLHYSSVTINNSIFIQVCGAAVTLLQTLWATYTKPKVMSVGSESAESGPDKDVAEEWWNEYDQNYYEEEEGGYEADDYYYDEGVYSDDEEEKAKVRKKRKLEAKNKKAAKKRKLEQEGDTEKLKDIAGSKSTTVTEPREHKRPLDTLTVVDVLICLRDIATVVFQTKESKVISQYTELITSIDNHVTLNLRTDNKFAGCLLHTTLAEVKELIDRLKSQSSNILATCKIIKL